MAAPDQSETSESIHAWYNSHNAFRNMIYGENRMLKIHRVYSCSCQDQNNLGDGGRRSISYRSSNSPGSEQRCIRWKYRCAKWVAHSTKTASHAELQPCAGGPGSIFASDDQSTSVRLERRLEHRLALKCKNKISLLCESRHSSLVVNLSRIKAFGKTQARSVTRRRGNSMYTCQNLTGQYD